MANEVSKWHSAIISEAQKPSDGVGIPVHIYAYGKRLDEHGAGELVGFGLHEADAKERFEELVGKIDYASPTAVDQPNFLYTQDADHGYPPALVVTHDKTGNVVICGVRNLEEDILALEKGGNSRPFLDYRAAVMDEKSALQLSGEGVHWMAAFAQSPLLRAFQTENTIVPDQELSISDATAFFESFDSHSSALSDPERFSRLFGLSLLSIQAGQPIIIEQSWSLQEKVLFMHMLQQTLVKTGSNHIVSWASEPIVKLHRDIQVIFKSPGDTVLDPSKKEWFAYRHLTEASGADVEEATLLEHITHIFAEASSIGEAEVSIAQMVADSTTDLNVLHDTARTRIQNQMEVGKRDQDRRYALVQEQFQSKANMHLNVALADWLCPPGSESMPEYVYLPPSYIQEYRNGIPHNEFMKKYDVGTPLGRFLYEFLSKKYSESITGLSTQSKIVGTLFDALSKKFIEDVGGQLRVNSRGLCAILDLANHLQAKQVRRFNATDDIYAEAFDSDTPASMLASNAKALGLDVQKIQTHLQGMNRSKDALEYINAWRRVVI